MNKTKQNISYAQEIIRDLEAFLTHRDAGIPPSKELWDEIIFEATIYKEQAQSDND